MRTASFVALRAIETGTNEPGDIALACVDDRGHLHQGVGNDPAVAGLVCMLIAEKQLRGSWSTEVFPAAPVDPRIDALRKVLEATDGGWVRKHELAQILEMQEEVVYGEGS
jgi:hypothetical protein